MIHSRATPHGATQYLLENKPEGLVFGPQWWGDWLAWSGPPELQVFMTTNLHLAPNRVWRDYLRVARGQAGWEQALDRYAVSTLILHKELQPGLEREVRRSANWRIAYEDELAVIAHRTP
jgi:phytoene dehydrogenase-like protein